MTEIPIYLDPCMYIPQGATPQERAQSKARIIADLQAEADDMNRRASQQATFVGCPPHMLPAAAWMCGPQCQDPSHLGSPGGSGFASHAPGPWGS